MPSRTPARAGQIPQSEDGLDPEQRAAVTAPRGPVCVLAGAGTGKTRTITRRIAHLVAQGHVAAGQVLAVTFTARAAGELRTRLRGLDAPGVQARTFHAAALRQLRYFWPQVIGGQPWPLLDGKFRLVGQAAARARAGTDSDALRDLSSEIEWAKSSLIAPVDYPAEAARRKRDVPGSAEQVAQVYAGYEELKNSAQMLDFDDLLLHTAVALEEHAGVAEEFRSRYRCFVVDEYQDVTPLQQRLLDAWVGDRDDLTVVGDANQTIYTFAGASPRYLLEFPRRFPGAAVVRLQRDYRSTPQIVSCANQLIGAARHRPAGSRLQLVGQLPPGPDPDFSEHDDEPAEAAAAAGRILTLLRDGTPPSEIAVLFRINAQSEAFEQALSDAGVPYQVRGGERFFARPEIRRAMIALRGAAPEQRPGTDLVDVTRAVLGARAGLSDEPPKGATLRAQWESLLALVGVAEELAAAEPAADLARLCTELDTRADSAQAPVVQGVTLASLHAAKGLEWDAVFLVGLADGTLPIGHAGDDEQAIEEERRLFYVGITRARRVLSMSWSLSRASGRGSKRRRSRFLYGLIPDSHPASRVAGERRPGGPRPRCRVCGTPLFGGTATKLMRCDDCPSDVDLELLDRLKQWRAGEAKQQDVPAFVVLTDATLTAIAEQRPADPAALVGIPGIGAAKLDRYGDAVLTLLAER
ncbi:MULTISPECIES: ATP-dependent DNA helicase UvrD2 [Pseudonocardia]|uniref:DNA 3'-5' helicase n=2 Tax=Pseudonocardia TaxID=1847 RepID=A0A1Y2N4W1_PSEAH|nr:MULTISPECIES: ATP-dependent DNA helicase UvrD2 [Pseudonocardia]OSY42522.1 ATP-dependent DNA helicase UvrD2 [Pseudonocardia autotrophica]TDN76041.1 Rep family ATP-dependent DNA helicase [Pseudonocardia autotrophica]BBG00018.1 DNA helicase [Pseudonocardia autotrophica]GEC28060.1 DNA helicase [Pseudonocardia saturnea]